MSKGVKNQHYVPRLYLRGFAKQKGKDYKICVYDKENGAIRGNQSIENVAAERYFYNFEYDKILDLEKIKSLKDGDEAYEDLKDFDINRIDKQFMEKHFSDVIEPKLKKMLDTIKSTHMLINKSNILKANSISNENKVEYSALIAIQFMRTKEFKQVIEQLPSIKLHMIKKIEKIHGDNNIDIDPEAVRYTKEHAKFEHIRYLMDSDILFEFSNTLFKHIWYIGINNTNINLYTSDSPVVVIPNYNGHMGGRGLGSIGAEVVFPISPELILVMKERSFHEKSLKYENGYKILNEIEVLKYNEAQIYGAYRNVFSIDDDFDIAKILRKLDPQMANINRKRIKVM